MNPKDAIDEIREKRLRLDRDVEVLSHRFEEETGMQIRDLSITHFDRDNGKGFIAVSAELKVPW